MWKGKNVFVTGASGFIGSHLTARLRVLGTKVEECKVDLLQNNLLEQSYSKSDYIFHLAAYSPSFTDKVYNVVVEEQNIKMTQNVLQLARSMNAVFVFVSSSHVYPKAKVLDGHPWIEDEMKYGKAFTPFGLSKQKCEALCFYFAREYNMNIIIARLSNVYGHGDVSNRFLPAFLRRVLGGESPLRVFGNKKTARDFVYINDVVNGIIDAGAYDKSEIFNLGSGRMLTIEQIAEEVLHTCGRDNEKIQYDSATNSAAEYNMLNISHAQRLINYNPLTSFDAGLKNTVEWYKNNT